MASNVPMFTGSHLGGGAFRGELRTDGLQRGLRAATPRRAGDEGIRKIMGFLFFFVIEGSLEVKLPTIWTVEKQR